MNWNFQNNQITWHTVFIPTKFGKRKVLLFITQWSGTFSSHNAAWIAISQASNEAMHFQQQKPPNKWHLFFCKGKKDMALHFNGQARKWRNLVKWKLAIDVAWKLICKTNERERKSRIKETTENTIGIPNSLRSCSPICFSAAMSTCRMDQTC